LGVLVGSPSFAGTAARTAHAPSADANANANVGAGAGASGGPDLAPFAPSTGSPTDGERLAPVGTPDDDGLTAEGPAASGAPVSASQDVEGDGNGDDLADVIDAGEGASPAEAAARRDAQI
jgi:hypothetical protein